MMVNFSREKLSRAIFALGVMWGLMTWGRVSAQEAGDTLDPEFLPQNLLQPFVAIGPRAAALGGAFVSLANDATAAAWNPAGIAQRRDTGLGLNLNYQTDNLDVDAIQDLADDYDQVEGDELDLDAFNSIRKYAQRVGGQTTSLDLSTAAPLPLKGSFSLIAYGQANLKFRLRDEVPPAGGHDARVDISAGALGVGYGSLAYAREVGDNTFLGIAAKRVWAYYQPLRFNVFQDGDSVSDNYDEDHPLNTNSHDTAWAFDLGLMVHRPLSSSGLVIRNLNQPTLSFDNPNGGSALSIDLEPQVDYGAAWFSEDRKTTASMEWHNLTQANDHPWTIHFGLEHRLGDVLTLRGGINGTDWVGGVGLHLGPIRLDVATGPHYQKYGAFSFNLSF